MLNAKLYEKYHLNRQQEKRVIYDFDYTHRPLLSILSNSDYKNKSVLDIGCGTGTTCFYFASKGASVLGVDVSKNAIELANINAKRLGLEHRTKFLLSSFPELSLKGKYNLIVCSEILEHIKDHKKALIKIRKLLSSDGLVVFSVPLTTSFLYRKKLLNNFDKEVGHLRRYDPTGFIKLIKNSKFDVIKTKKNQGILRDYLFTSTTRSIIVAIANRFKIVSDLLTFIDEKLFFFGVSNLVVLARKK